MANGAAGAGIGRRVVVVALLVAALTIGAPLARQPEAAAQAQSPSCACYASFDGIDSDLQYVDWYSHYAVLGAAPPDCSTACEGWRRQWFYDYACDFPVRINRGRNAWWGYADGLTDNHIGPDTWWCPNPPP